MKSNPTFKPEDHDERDPSPWYALYLDQSTPLPDTVKSAWLIDSSSRSRQYLLPFVRPIARTTIILIQIVKVVLPKKWVASKALHWVLAEGMKRFLSPQANWLILRHFHLGSQALAFIAKNSPYTVETSPLKPSSLDDLKDELFLKHDLNLFNFVIRLNQSLREKKASLGFIENPDFSMIQEPDLKLSDLPSGWFNFMDSQTAIEFFTPKNHCRLKTIDKWV